MRYLVIGGAGYIGSHTALVLRDQGHDVTVLDNLSTGHRDAVLEGIAFKEVDLNDVDDLNKVLASDKFDGVLHFAALSQVGTSMQQPFHYLRTNSLTSLNLIESCINHSVEKIVFSSTAALFGDAGDNPIAHDALVAPGSPYGESKHFIERTLDWAARIHGLKYATLRYFNAAGADPEGHLGEDHRPETHLIPLAIDAALGRRPKLHLFGNDYPTKDGTCVRDYIHVVDLADAHIRALDALDKTGSNSLIYNLGNGNGFSNLEVIQSVSRVLGKEVPWEWAPRRPGDPAVLVADSSRIKKETGWDPKFSDLDKIVETAALWREKHPNGYNQ